MKVLVLGLDSVDAHRLSDRYNLPELTLEESAKVSLDGLHGVEVHTKVIWPIFLDGKHPHQEEVEQTAMERLSGLARLLGVPGPIKQRVGELLDQTGASGGGGRAVDIDESFLREASPRVALSVPGLGEFTIVDDIRRALVDQLSDTPSRSLDDFLDLCEAEHEIKRAATSKALSHADVVMTHFYSLDAIQHIGQGTDEELVEEWYRRYADTVADFLDQLEPEDTVVVLSDHGMEDGVHGPDGKGAYAYAASSKSIGLSDGMSITEVHDRLKETVARTCESAEQEANDRNALADEGRRSHLEDLGYL